MIEITFAVKSSPSPIVTRFFLGSKDAMDIDSFCAHQTAILAKYPEIAAQSKIQKRWRPQNKSAYRAHAVQSMNRRDRGSWTNSTQTTSTVSFESCLGQMQSRVSTLLPLHEGSVFMKNPGPWTKSLTLQIYSEKERSFPYSSTDWLDKRLSECFASKKRTKDHKAQHHILCF